MARKISLQEMSGEIRRVRGRNQLTITLRTNSFQWLGIHKDYFISITTRIKLGSPRRLFLLI